MNENLPSAKILGTKITTASKREIIDYILKSAAKGQEKTPIVTPNPEILMYAARHKDYQEILNRAAISLPDGIGVLISGRLLKKGIKSRITGVDLMDELCREAAKKGLTVGFLGGMAGVAEETADCLAKKYPDLRVVYKSEEWDVKKIENGELRMENSKKMGDQSTLNSQFSNPKSHIDILFVAFGFPKQEVWIDENLDKIPVTVAMGVGGAFDYISGNVMRAPKIVRDVGMEWAFRLVREPWRLKRQMALPKFAFEVLKERFS